MEECIIDLAPNYIYIYITKFYIIKIRENKEKRFFRNEPSAQASVMKIKEEREKKYVPRLRRKEEESMFCHSH